MGKFQVAIHYPPNHPLTPLYPLKDIPHLVCPQSIVPHDDTTCNDGLYDEGPHYLCYVITSKRAMRRMIKRQATRFILRAPIRRVTHWWYTIYWGTSVLFCILTIGHISPRRRFLLGDISYHLLLKPFPCPSLSILGACHIYTTQKSILFSHDILSWHAL